MGHGKYGRKKFDPFFLKSQVYNETIQTSKIELFVKLVNGWKPLIIFAKRFILDIWLGSEYASDSRNTS